ncbi:MAG: preprotein translocase subunit SecA [Oscillospiraceae bacterium]|nr:preprotein translocase subunit SecA [Oscillospiraceae bacterium]MDD6082137.1 preprotein translocase subunit SecA [Oscillospiraceae bacterium]
MSLIDKIFGSYSKKELARIEPIKQAVLDLDEEYSKLSEQELKGKTQIFKDRLAAGEDLDTILPEALATCREAAYRVLGKKPFPVQIIGAIVLHQGRIAEMKTGEGKTLVACLAAYLNALSGKGVHVVTVNDYLAKFQSEEMGKVYRYLGLSIGVILHGLNNTQRRAAYNCDITYATNNELGFDYLRDNMVIYKKDMVQREPNFAIVDEVDSILIDEARTPLIISGRGEKSTELYGLVDKFAKTLKAVTVVEMDDKEDQDELNKDYDYIIDEKSKSATITRTGVKKAEKYFNVENLMDSDNMTLLHHINQALKANGVMKRDIDYVVKDGEVIIVDEFTGRLMMGRRYNDGLHQAIEAKEGVKVAHESKTLATITFQNYFRLYNKLSGMTGTAMTEEDEFKEIYKLDVIQVPTNRPVQRIDHSDQVYRTEKGKFEAVIDQIVECNKKGQPVLVGTVSIEKSEILSSLLKKKGIKHNVLNAKQHEKEAEIVAQAGKLGAVTIATNMAGRGTDIILGGNAEFQAKAEMRKKGYEENIINEAVGYAETDDEEILAARKVYRELYDKFDAEVKEKAVEVREAGGLFIIGTERHESRRIDNQLRGRSGRQGDQGESRFFLSLEDDLMRIFAADRIENLMKSLNVEETMPIESKFLTKMIESSQKKVEGRNFSIRKNVLNYDDVMNKQREIIYDQRAKVLNGDDLHESIVNMIKVLVSDTVDRYLLEDGEDKENWNIIALKEYFLGWITNEDDFKDLEDDADKFEAITKKEVTDMLTERALKIYSDKEEQYGKEVIRELERVILLRVVDSKWTAHIDDMDELKKGISLRAYGQKNPVVEYRYEGFEMFDAMVESIREDTVRMLLTVKLSNNQAPERVQVNKPDAPNAGSGDGSFSSQAVSNKTGDNELCPCGSGKKYKKCCGLNSDN